MQARTKKILIITSIAAVVLALPILLFAIIRTPRLTPYLSVSIGDEQVWAAQLSHEWRWTFRRLTVEAVNPWEFFESSEAAVTLYSINFHNGDNEVVLSFTEAPSELTLRKWTEYGYKLVELYNSRFTVTNSGSNYIFEAVANWPAGWSSYAFMLLLSRN